MTCLLKSMVVHDFHFGRTRTSLGPFEADSPLVVDADTPLPFSLAHKCLETVAGSRQVAQTSGRVKLVELARSGPGEPGKGRDPATLVERFGFTVRETADHNAFRFKSNRISFTPAKTSALRKA